ncbi:glycosyltransferase [Kordiimonas sp. SCSIO 12603]|uniref:glycosyltransferase n=1 Tax=Kordiimonas sp. SCSIO 12603 TaxID=2829596 RepID=UPI002107F467|nr:glycosyltransferase [Kordiimonas sp. SCSIO 12603]UTW59684.1 glycosyltransferase [Kordiimonas sp. SCSIO 12603]
MSTKKNLLIITHNITELTPGGGIEVYQDIIRKNPEYNVFFLVKTTRNNTPEYIVRTPDEKFRIYALEKQISVKTVKEDQRMNLVVQLIREHKIDLVHFQHLLGHPLGLPKVLQNMKIPMLYTLQDFYLTCFKFNLRKPNGSFCNTFDHSVSQCNFCLQATHNIEFGYQEQRRAFIGEMLSNFAGLISSTNYTKNAFQKIYPHLPDDLFHILPLPKPWPSNDQERPTPKPKGEFLEVAIPGNYNSVKGGDLMFELIRGLQHEKIRFTVLGRIQEPKYKELFEKHKFPNLIIKGGYDPKDIIDILKDYDVSLHLSVWPETYMITLSEAWTAGVVPIVTNLGAQGERVEHDKNGFAVPVDGIGEVYDALKSLLDSPKKLIEMKQAAIDTFTPTGEDHIPELNKIYEKVLSAHPKQGISVIRGK